MGRPRNEEIPQHPTVIPEIVVAAIYGRDTYAVQIVCPGCGATRVRPANLVRQAIKKGDFTGRCAACRAPARAARTLGAGRSRQATGYIALREHPEMTADDLQLHRRMRGGFGVPWVLEHHFLIAREIGRPLRGYEDVIHRNGKRDDNRLENLELVFARRSGPSPVLRELERARQLIEAYAPIEAILASCEQRKGQS